MVLCIVLTLTLEKLPRYSSKMVVVCLSSFSLERRTGFSSGVLMSVFCTIASTSLLSLTDGKELSRDVGCGLSRCALLPRELRPSTVTNNNALELQWRLGKQYLCSAEADWNRRTHFQSARSRFSLIHKISSS